MLRNFIKNIPFLYTTALSVKHRLWSKATENAFKNYALNNRSPKLQLGAGQNIIEGWFNTDYFVRDSIFFLDATKPFPFPADVFDGVYSEHHIEHISYKQAVFMLGEIFRVMKPGGYIKIATPDLKKYVSSYVDNSLNTPMIKQHAKDWIYSGFAYAKNYIPVNDHYEAHFVNDIFLNYEHRFIYDAAALNTILEKAGFIIINEASITQNSFTGIESHTSPFDRLFTLTVYAQKP